MASCCRQVTHCLSKTTAVCVCVCVCVSLSAALNLNMLAAGQFISGYEATGLNSLFIPAVLCTQCCNCRLEAVSFVIRLHPTDSLSPPSPCFITGGFLFFFSLHVCVMQCTPVCIEHISHFLFFYHYYVIWRGFIVSSTFLFLCILHFVLNDCTKLDVVRVCVSALFS